MHIHLLVHHDTIKRPEFHLCVILSKARLFLGLSHLILSSSGMTQSYLHWLGDLRFLTTLGPPRISVL